MSDTGNESGDNLKLIIFALIYAMPMIASGIGVLPLVVLLLGAVLSYRTGDMGNLHKTTMLVQYAIYALAILLAGLMGFAMMTVDTDIMLLPALVGMVIIITAGVLLPMMWSEPLANKIKSHPRRVRAKGPALPDVIKRQSMQPYSVADELRKWSDLHQSGTITEEEYQAARQRLLDTH